MEERVPRRRDRVLVLAAIALLVAACEHDPIILGYRKMVVDPTTLLVRVEDPIPAGSENGG